MIAPDVTGPNKSSGSERESLSKGAGHADEEVQAGADRNIAAADGSRNRQRVEHPTSLEGS